MVKRKRYVRRKRRVARPRRRVARKRVVKRRRLGSTGRQQTLQRVWTAAAAGTGFSAIKDAYDVVSGATGPRKRARTQTKTRTRPGEEGTGGYAQWTRRYAQGKFGRLTPKKIDSLSLEKNIYTHRRIGPFNDYGQLFLTNRVTAGGALELPLVLFELNSCNNHVNGVTTYHSPVRTLRQVGLNMEFLAQTGQTPDGTLSSSFWQLENSAHPNLSGQSQVGETAIHKWSSLDLELWGTRNKPTRYTIELVQFSEDVLPAFDTTIDGNKSEFWQAMVKHYTYSPMAQIDDGYGRKKYKVLKRYSVSIDPTASYENDPDPHVKTMKLFYRFNRKCRFNWQFNTPDVQSIANMNEPDWRQEANQNMTQVHPNARIYVMIRASNFTRLTSTDTVDNSTNPSISWRLRTCWLTNA